ncbi:MAG: tyrosine-protein phosphatase [Pseudomonadota bacterium]
MEKGICDKLGINLSDDLILFSRTAPSREMILKFKAHFEALEHPILIHCKSGADRMGLASVLYLHLIDQVPIEKALDQLSLRYGHIKQAKTGILDEFFKSYLTYKKDNNITFIEWVESVYDERELKNTYNSQSWADALVDLILRRE